MVHLVYPYREADNELLYSLRSWDKHFKDDFDVTIIGDPLPATIQKGPALCWIPLTRIPAWTTEQNLGRVLKWILALETKYQDTTDILWVNDDLYLLQDLKAEFFYEPHAIQDMTRLTPVFSNCSWGNTLWATYDLVRENGFSGYNYETHLPYRFNIEKLRILCKLYPVLSGQALLATAYYNTFYPDVPGEFRRILMLYDKNNPNKILDTDLWLNHNQEGYTDYVRAELACRFPEPSRFELST